MHKINNNCAKSTCVSLAPRLRNRTWPESQTASAWAMPTLQSFMLATSWFFFKFHLSYVVEAESSSRPLIPLLTDALSFPRQKLNSGLLIGDVPLAKWNCYLGASFLSLQPQYWVPGIMARKAKALGQDGPLCDAPGLHLGIRPKLVSSSDLVLADFLPRVPYLPSLNSTPLINKAFERESLPPASREWELRHFLYYLPVAV